MPHERAILLVKCDFLYSCAAADKISTDLRALVVSLQQLSYLLYFLRGIVEIQPVDFTCN